MRIHFTGEDLLRVRYAAEPAPLLELSLALASLHDPGADPVFTRWRREQHRDLPPRARPLLDLIPPCGRGPLFLDPVIPDVEEALDHVAHSPGQLVHQELVRVSDLGRRQTPWIRALAGRDRESWRALLTAQHAAYSSLLLHTWPRLTAGFHAEVTWRTTRWGRLGVGAGLESTWPGSHFVGTVWHLAPEKDIDIRLNGSGLTLYPTSLWSGPPLMGPYPDGSKYLIYPALTPLPLLPEPRATDPLGTLLGRTRAHVLEALTERRTTGHLAHGLGISPASASQHASALRAAGLIATRREGKAAWHECTALGAELLRTSRERQR